MRLITVDVFDTLLYRKTYPEDLQFIQHGTVVGQILRQRHNIDVHPYYIYRLRKHARSITDEVLVDLGDGEEPSHDRESGIRDIFRVVLDAIFRRFNIECDEQSTAHTLEEIVEAEIAVEKDSLLPNHQLVSQLRTYKQRGVRIYYLSDMYLGAREINELLSYFGLLDIFDGGFTSSDEGVGKGTGRLFEKLPNLIQDYDVFTHVHVGDNKNADFVMPQRLDIAAVHLQDKHHLSTRPKTTNAGNQELATITSKYVSEQRSKMERILEEKRKALNRAQLTFYNIGAIVAPSLIKYVEFLGSYAKEANTAIYLLSSEGKSFDRLLEALRFRVRRHRLLGINRIYALRAFAYASLRSQKVNMTPQIIPLFLMGEGKNDSESVLLALGLDKHEVGISDIGLAMSSPTELIGVLIKAEEEYRNMSDALASSYDRVMSILDSVEFFAQDKVIFGDVGWNGTIQLCLEQLLQVLGKKIRCKGIYLGVTGSNIFGLKTGRRISGVIFGSSASQEGQDLLIEEIWEFILTYPFPTETNSAEPHPIDSRLDYIWQGIDDVVNLYMSQLHIDCDLLYEMTHDELVRFFQRPTFEESRLMGRIEHEAGFGSKLIKPIVDASYSAIDMRKMYFRNSRAFYRILFSQYWVGGFLAYYNLYRFTRGQSTLLKFFKRIAKKVTRRSYS